MPGIFSGIILAIGRIVGESAALIFTAGTVAEVAKVFSVRHGLWLYICMLSQERDFMSIKPTLQQWFS